MGGGVTCISFVVADKALGEEADNEGCKSKAPEIRNDPKASVNAMLKEAVGLMNSPVLPTPLPPSTAILMTRLGRHSELGYSAIVDMFWMRRILTKSRYFNPRKIESKQEIRAISTPSTSCARQTPRLF